MTTIGNNSASLSALRTLQMINREMAVANERISTGNKINNAGDSATYWSIATQTASDNSALNGVVESLSFAESILSVSQAALDGIRSGVEDIKDLLVQARAPGADKDLIGEQITGIASDLDGLVAGASVNDVNILKADATANDDFSIVAGLTRTGGALTVQTIDITADDLLMLDDAATAGVLEEARTTLAAGGLSTLGALVTSATTDANLELYLVDVDAVLADVLDVQSDIGSAQGRVSSQKVFIEAIMAANDQAISSMVEADMEEESTRLRALQTQQQLAIEALSITNSTQQSVLGLFR